MFVSEAKEKSPTLIVHPDIYVGAESLSEIELLAQSSGACIVKTVSVTIRKIHPTSYITSGKVDELAQLVAELEVEVVIVNASLSPSQERNLERILKCRVIDRNRLILDIFSQRARSHEGKLQVELAQLEYLSTRLIRGWTHLERQKGGIGLRGPGESQLETDRRLLAVRVISLKKQLSQVRKQRLQNRQNRLRSATPTLALVGYTNAGKSTLFNRLTQSNAYVANQLFATLDTTSRRILVPGIGDCVITDTVGFIQHLPHKLIDAFQATLEEVPLADVLLHVVDASDSNNYQKLDAVQSVLDEIGAGDIMQVIIYNKVDMLGEQDLKKLSSHEIIGNNKYPLVPVSAQTGFGMEQLYTAIGQMVSTNWYKGWIRVRAKEAGATRASLHSLQSIEEEKNDENGNLMLRVSVRNDYIYNNPQITPLTKI